MMRYFTLFTFLLLLSTNIFSTEHYKFDRADSKIRGAEEVWYKTNVTVPHYIRFRNDFVVKEHDVVNWLRAQFEIPANLKLESLKSVVTDDGVKHHAYQLTFNDVVIEFQRLIVHSLNGNVRSISGNILNFNELGNNIILNKEEAIEMALRIVDAGQYKWEIPSEEEWLRRSTDNPNATFYPEPELVIISRNADYKHMDLRYAYKMNVYAHDPMSSQDIYIDAQGGEMLFRHNMINEADSNGIAHTAFSGIRQIATDFVSNEFFLRESGRGMGIHTWNMQNGTDFGNAVDFKDEDNNWLYSQGNLDAYATDAHWGAEMTYDYLGATFNRDGIDGSGFKLESYIHFDEGYNNARWDAKLQIMVYGDGPNNMIPLTTLDIVGHEIGHGMTQFTAGLIYQNESGALSESFSDILGNCVEYFGKPGSASWQIGEDLGSFLRDMSFPNAKGQPDTYKGDNWYIGTNDNGGVHTNSGVQNFWFYLLTEGGNGKNDINYSYNVDGIGIVNSALIAHRALTVYLTPTSDYEEASFYSTMAAIDLFGNCSSQHEATVEAWNAVGIENNYIDHTVASFNADVVDYCNTPFTVDFKNSSVNGVLYNWSIENENNTVNYSSTDTDISYTFTESGVYNVKLKVDGEGCGLSEVVKENLITVSGVNAPSSESQTIYKGESVLLDASVSVGEVNWFEDEAGTILIGKGNTYQTPELQESKVYYIKTIEEGASHELGKNLTTSTNGGFSSLNVGLKFDVFQDLILESVKVKAESPGDRTVTIKKGNGVTVFEKVVKLTTGEQRVELNASLKPGDNYELSYSGGVQNLWISDDNEFPYEFSGLISIKGNTLDIEGIYPFFFNIIVKEEDCESALSNVAVTVLDINDVKLPPYKFYVQNTEEFIYYIDFFFKHNTEVQFELYGVNGQLMGQEKRTYFAGGKSDSKQINVNDLLQLNSYSTGIYFLTIKGGGLEKTEKIVNKGGSN